MSETEKRLVEATALLERFVDEVDCDIYDDPCHQELVFAAKSFLSATHSPAVGTPWQQFQEWAETHPDNPERRAPSPADPARVYGGEGMPDVEAEPAPLGPEPADVDFVCWVDGCDAPATGGTHYCEAHRP